MLEGKTLFITGSGRGIGEAIARRAKDYGARLVLHDKQDSDALQRLARELDASSVVFDVADEGAARTELAGVGRIDVLVNNAGVNPSKTFAELTSGDWQEIFDVNVFGLVKVSQAVIPGMAERGGGVILHIASVKGFPSISGKPAYAASKAAVMRITSSMAEEFAPQRIRVNAIAPGFVDTAMTKASMSPAIQAQIDRIPLKRMAKPEEVAEAALFLASEKASYITGQTLVVDGGYSVT